jgi:hypothetical protein
VHSHEAKIDDRVLPLIEELNRFPGVRTFASCGGHPKVRVTGFVTRKNHGREGQVRYPHFYVSFMIDPSPAAGWSLRLISWAAYDASLVANVRYGATVMMWAPSPSPEEPPRFDLYGKISVELLVKTLRLAREEYIG